MYFNAYKIFSIDIISSYFIFTFSVFYYHLVVAIATTKSHEMGKLILNIVYSNIIYGKRCEMHI